MLKFNKIISSSRLIFKIGNCNVITRTIGSNMDNSNEVLLPIYKFKQNEKIEDRRNRLIYQSRKRGMLENDLLLSTFADEYLDKMSPEMLHQYDLLLNIPSNDWDIYYWATGNQPVPEEFDNDVMKLLRNHVNNPNKKIRIRQPDLKYK